MHILQLVPSLEVGGVERGVLDVAKGLIARGHRASVISSGGALVDALTSMGATHFQLPIHNKSLTSMVSCIPQVARLIQEHGVDIVHARSRVPGWIGWAAARRAQRPFVTTAHGFYRSHLASRVMGWGRCVIVPSEALGRYLMEHFQVPKERLRVIPRGVDLGAFTFQPPPRSHQGPWRIGLFGRLSPIKGHEVALRACARLRRQGHAVTLCLAGDTPDSPLRASLEPLIRNLKLPGAVEWLGVRHDMPIVIASVDMVIVPSLYPESFGRSVIEAQAVGRPVIASRLGALEDLIEDGQTGLLVRAGDAQALARALEQFMSDESLRAQCVEAAHRQAQTRWDLTRMVEQTLQIYEECIAKPRVVIWKLSALGDVILSTPSLRAIRRNYPQAHVALVVGRAAYDVVARCPYLDEIIIYDPARKDRGPLRALAFLKRLRHSRFDLSIDLQNSRTTHGFAWALGIPVRIGYRRKGGWLLNRGVRLPRVILAPIAHQHYLLQHAGLSPNGDALELWPSPRDAERAARLVPEGGQAAPAHVVALHPGGSGRWKTKRWDIDRWARLCEALTQRGLRVLITGGADEGALTETLLRMTNSKPEVLVGQTSIMELACVLKRCDVFIGHDSSPLHIAAAMGTPAIALFGPTDPQRHLPPHFAGQVIKKDVFCSPCYSPRCRTVTHACMKNISVEEVVEAVLALLADKDQPPSFDRAHSPTHLLT